MQECFGSKRIGINSRRSLSKSTVQGGQRNDKDVAIIRGKSRVSVETGSQEEVQGGKKKIQKSYQGTRGHQGVPVTKREKRGDAKGWATEGSQVETLNGLRAYGG